ncbi:D-aminoacyl-tRNA deacylase [Lacticaseibacillus jixianensis]|uniref:D-aminoacyl-tRNA deacylase n=1 Tax=Lacticaseibacillus jixianensis TaxID=2486012 RepID=A0ABW4BAH7_9LACO|nr:D-aminoacyl-tRNA deacylase [Lacticaseibacillus jixianensis]
MRAVLQRVSQASVTIEGRTTGQIQQGFLILLGVGPQDTPADVDWLVNKISKLRVFSDEQGKMNLALAAVGGAVLVVSQFTLYADVRRGNRPSFTAAAAPALGQRLYEAFLTKFEATGIPVAHGEFGADMQVALTNDGPVTILLDTEETHAG